MKIAANHTEDHLTYRSTNQQKCGITQAYFDSWSQHNVTEM